MPSQIIWGAAQRVPPPWSVVHGHLLHSDRHVAPSQAPRASSHPWRQARTSSFSLLQSIQHHEHFGHHGPSADLRPRGQVCYVLPMDFLNSHLEEAPGEASRLLQGAMGTLFSCGMRYQLSQLFSSEMFWHSVI